MRLTDPFTVCKKSYLRFFILRVGRKKREEGREERICMNNMWMIYGSGVTPVFLLFLCDGRELLNNSLSILSVCMSTLCCLPTLPQTVYPFLFSPKNLFSVRGHVLVPRKSHTWMEYVVHKMDPRMIHGVSHLLYTNLFTLFVQ